LNFDKWLRVFINDRCRKQYFFVEINIAKVSWGNKEAFVNGVIIRRRGKG
jgi:hypothetical protein